MNEPMLELRQRRGELLARIDAQRGQLAEIAASLEEPLALADQGVSILRFFRAHPLLLAGITAFAVVRWRGVAGLVRSALMVWNGYRLFTGARQKQ